jgi:hypothetical protein
MLSLFKNMILMSNIRLGQWARMWMGWIRTQSFVNWIPLEHVGMGKQIWKQCLVNMFHFVALWQMVAKRFHVNSNGFFKHFWELNGGTWYWTYELFKDLQVTYLQIKRLEWDWHLRKMLSFSKDQKIWLGGTTIFLNMAKWVCMWFHVQKCKKALWNMPMKSWGILGYIMYL